MVVTGYKVLAQVTGHVVSAYRTDTSCDVRLSIISQVMWCQPIGVTGHMVSVHRVTRNVMSANRATGHVVSAYRVTGHVVSACRVMTGHVVSAIEY